MPVVVDYWAPVVRSLPNGGAGARQGCGAKRGTVSGREGQHRRAHRSRESGSAFEASRRWRCSRGAARWRAPPAPGRPRTSKRSSRTPRRPSITERTSAASRTRERKMAWSIVTMALRWLAFGALTCVACGTATAPGRPSARPAASPATFDLEEATHRRPAGADDEPARTPRGRSSRNTRRGSRRSTGRARPCAASSSSTRMPCRSPTSCDAERKAKGAARSAARRSDPDQGQHRHGRSHDDDRRVAGARGCPRAARRVSGRRGCATPAR